MAFRDTTFIHIALKRRQICRKTSLVWAHLILKVIKLHRHSAKIAADAIADAQRKRALFSAGLAIWAEE